VARDCPKERWRVGLERDEALGMTRSRLGAVETHPPKSPPKRALYTWGAYEGGAATRRARGGLQGNDVGDRPEKRPASEAGSERGTGPAIAPLLFAATWNDRSRRK
jgi:hypothetical protein